MLGCRARVRDPVYVAHDGSMEIIDLDGKSIGFVPHSIEAIEMAALIRIVERAFQEGVKVRRGLAL